MIKTMNIDIIEETIKAIEIVHGHEYANIYRRITEVIMTRASKYRVATVEEKGWYQLDPNGDYILGPHNFIVSVGDGVLISSKLNELLSEVQVLEDKLSQISNITQK